MFDPVVLAIAIVQVVIAFNVPSAVTVPPLQVQLIAGDGAVLVEMAICTK